MSGKRSTIKVRDAEKGVIYHLVLDGNVSKLNLRQLSKFIEQVSKVPVALQELALPTLDDPIIVSEVLSRPSPPSRGASRLRGEDPEEEEEEDLHGGTALLLEDGDLISLFYRQDSLPPSHSPQVEDEERRGTSDRQSRETGDYLYREETAPRASVETRGEPARNALPVSATAPDSRRPVEQRRAMEKEEEEHSNLYVREGRALRPIPADGKNHTSGSVEDDRHPSDYYTPLPDTNRKHPVGESHPVSSSASAPAPHHAAPATPTVQDPSFLRRYDPAQEVSHYPVAEDWEDPTHYTAAELEDLIRRRDNAWEAERLRFNNERELKRKQIEAQRKMLLFEANRYDRESNYLLLQTEKEKRKLRDLQSALSEDVQLGEDLFRSNEYLHHAPPYLMNNSSR